MDLTSLKFGVDTTELKTAVDMVGKLVASVASLDKPIQAVSEKSKTLSTSINNNSKAVDENTASVKKNQTILERQEDILKFMSQGYSKGQASVLAMGKAAGLADTEMERLSDTIQTQRKLIGGDPFDKSVSGLRSMTQQLGQAREGYRQMLEYQNKYKALRDSGDESGAAALTSLSKKETDNLYRDKTRLIELFKQGNNAELSSMKQLKAALRDVENSYKAVATAKRPLDNLRTVDATKRADELRYLARATSVQLGDIGISLAGGQNPITVFLQQGDQLRGVFNQVGASANEMKAALSTAFSQIVRGFVDVAAVLGKFVVGAFVEAFQWTGKFLASLTGIPQMFNLLDSAAQKAFGKDNSFSKFLSAISPALINITAAAVAALVATIVAAGVAFSKLLSVQADISAALNTNGAAIAITTKEAMALSAALADGSGTTVQYAAAIAEMAKAGNISKNDIATVSKVALEAERTLGIAVGDTVKEFSKLKDDPVKALTEIGLATGRVSLGQVDYIQDLIESGDKVKALEEATKLWLGAHQEGLTQGKADMTPLGQLWLDMKTTLNEIVDGMYKFANSAGVVGALRAIWDGLVAAVTGYIYSLKQVMLVLGGISAVGLKVKLGDFGGAIDEIKTVRSELAANTKEFEDNAEKRKKAALEVNRVDTEGNKLRRDQFKAEEAAAKIRDKHDTKSVLNASQRSKFIKDNSEQLKAYYAVMKQGASGERLAKLNKEESDALGNIKDYYNSKGKKGSGDRDKRAAEKDEFGAELKEIANKRKEIDRTEKSRIEELKFRQDMELTTTKSYIEEKYKIESESLQATLKTYEEEKKILEKKKNNKKELEELAGKVTGVKQQQAELPVKQERELAVASFKEVRKNDKAGMQEAESYQKEAEAIAESNKQLRAKYELQGLSETQTNTLINQRQALLTIDAEWALINAQNMSMGTDADNARIAALERILELRKQEQQLIANSQESTTVTNLKAIANITGTMGDGFTKATKSLQGFAKGIDTIQKAQKNMKQGSIEQTSATVGGYAEMAGAAKNFFEEGTTGYDVLSKAEQAFRAIQLAMSIAAMAQDNKETLAAIANSAEKLIAYVVEAAAKFFGQSGWGGFAGVAAMMAVLAGLGYAAMGGGGGGGSGDGGYSGNGSYAETGYVLNDNGRVGKKPPLDYNSNENADRNPEYDTWIETEAAANRAYTALRAVNSGLTELEQVLVDVKKGVQGTGRAAYEAATEGMSDAERATYDYNASLRMQAAVLVDIANGTENTSDNMRKLAKESEQLSVDLMRASGNIAEARRMQELIDTRGFSEQEIAVYRHNQAMQDQIQAYNDASGAAEDLAQKQWDVSSRLNLLLNRTTQVQIDRAAELASTTDASVISMLNLIYELEDLNTLIDNNFATLQRSIEAEKKLATARLQGATALQNALKSAVSATTEALTRAQAQERLLDFLELAKTTGALPTSDAIASTIKTLSAPSEELFGNFVDYQRDFLKTANNIREMSNFADKQVSIEQQTLDNLDLQLETAQKQLDVLRGVDTSVKDVTTAVNDFNAAMQALAEKQANSPTYSYNPVGGGGGGGGGYSYGGGESAPAFENIAGQDNKDIVAAYRAYFNRNPDEGGYAVQLEAYNKGLKGDALMKSILRGAQGGDADIARSRGFDPSNPDAKYLKSILHPSTSSSSSGGNGDFYDDYGISASMDVGSNYLPSDMVIKAHQGERILPAADNRELFRRLQSPEDNAVVLAAAVARLTKEVEGLRIEQRQTAINTGDTSKILKRLGGEDDMLTVKVAE